LLIKPSALGDIVHALPVLSGLRRRFPGSHITWLVNKTYAPLLVGHPQLDAVLPFDRQRVLRGWWQGTHSFLRLLDELRRARFDLVVDLQGLLRSGLMTRATGARCRLGLRSAREGARWAYTRTVDDTAADLHAVDRYWLTAEALGAGDGAKQFVFPSFDVEARWARQLLHGLARPILAFNLGTRWETKRWPVEHFATLAQRAMAAFGGTILLVGGPDETTFGERLRDLVRGQVVDMIGRTTLPQLAALLRMVDAMISNDSGPLHLAAALGRPVVAPFTCTSPARTGAYGQQASCIATTVWCAASYRKTCARLECMDELTPDRLWPVLESILQTWQRQSA
jgi:lipopolysaccharide heptosyltransferase I